MRRVIGFALLFVMPPALKPLFLRWVCGATVGKGASLGWFATVSARHVSLGDHASIQACTVIRCDGEVALGRYAQVSQFNLVYGSASFIVGDHSYVGPQSLINCDEDVRLGNHTALGARSVVYTHGSWLPYTEGYWVRFGPVTLGNHVWCAAGVFLHPATSIGDRVFVNSRSVVTGTIPDDSIVEGVPAKVVARMDQLRRRMTPARVDAAIIEMLEYFVEVALRRRDGLQPVREGDTWRVDGRSGTWWLIPVLSRRDTEPFQPHPAERTVHLINRPGWTTAQAIGAHLDFTTMKSRSDGDAVCGDLVEFLKRYYGVQFERE